jgi:hypothetical protein
MKLKELLSDEILEESGIGKFIGALFNARNEAHRIHLDTESYAQHMALNEFYDSIIDLADSFAEAARGKHGKFNISYDINFQADSALDFITQFTEWLVNEGLKLVPEDSYLLNILDEIQALAYSVKYKIETLK